MNVFELSALETLACGLLAGVLGTLATRYSSVLQKLDIPSAVVGGLFVAPVVAGLRSYGGIELHFASALSDFFLLMFFTTVGLSAKLSSLTAGGRPLLILCAVTVLIIVVQNIIGALLALARGAEYASGQVTVTSSSHRDQDGGQRHHTVASSFQVLACFFRNALPNIHRQRLTASRSQLTVEFRHLINPLVIVPLTDGAVFSGTIVVTLGISSCVGLSC